jgi:hypothetical protein
MGHPDAELEKGQAPDGGRLFLLPYFLPYFQNSKLGWGGVTFGAKLYSSLGQYFAGEMTIFGS